MKILCTNNIKFPGNNPFEVVERKGIGHPDTVADAVAERISVEYSKYCLEHFRVVLHHNVDKFAALGGLVQVDWGKGELIKPIRALVNGRISASFNHESIPLKEIYTKAIKDQLAICLPSLNSEKWLEIIDHTTTYSKNPHWFNPLGLNDIPDHSNLFANDTSAVVSYWPLTQSEQLVLKLEGYFYDKNEKPRFKQFGQDIKVMVVRRKNKFDVTLCVPFFSKYLKDTESYWSRLYKLESELTGYAKNFLGNSVEIDLKVNPHDQRRKGTNDAKSFYFVAAGGALDYGEEGVVGRGNNRLGIIPSFRPYTMEAACGKNPIYHVGKVLGLVSDVLAKRIATECGCNTEVWIVTRNADPLFEPNNIIVNTSENADNQEIEGIVRKVLSERDWTKKILDERAIVPKTGNLY
jgi:S-adenosylmethionine synthetase